MAGAEIRTCTACGGLRGTEKTEHTLERDAEGRLTPQANHFWSPCSMCGGSGTVVVG